MLSLFLKYRWSCRIWCVLQVPAEWSAGALGGKRRKGLSFLWRPWVRPDRIRIPPQHAERGQLHPADRPPPSCCALRAFIWRGEHVHQRPRWVSVRRLLSDLRAFVTWFSFLSLSVVVVCIVSYLTTYHFEALCSAEAWILALLSTCLLVFSGCVLMVCRQPQTSKKVSFMVGCCHAESSAKNPLNWQPVVFLSPRRCLSCLFCPSWAYSSTFTSWSSWAETLGYDSRCGWL